RRHTRCYRDWSSDVCSSDLARDARGVTATLTAATAATPECATLTATIAAGRPTPVNLAAYAEAPLPDPCPEATRARWESVATLEIGRASCRERVEAWAVRVG